MKTEGFSLLEMLVVISVIGILSAIGIFNYISWIRSSKADNAVSEITNLMSQGTGAVRRLNTAVKVSMLGKTVSLSGAITKSVTLDINNDLSLVCRSTNAACDIDITPPYGTFATDSAFTVNNYGKIRKAYYLGPYGVLKVIKQ